MCSSDLCEMSMEFAETITSRERLRELVPVSPHAPVLDKQVAYLNDPARRFIASCPFLILATVDARGRMDVSPKGDPPGFVEVLDEHTLIIPDRLGNHRLDSYENILANPAVGLIFIIPGHTETLRVSGRGRNRANRQPSSFCSARTRAGLACARASQSS